jgi:hypothetical protein
LQILAKRIIVDTNGEIIDHELHSPFVYLTSLSPGQRKVRGSSKVDFGPQVTDFTELPADEVGNFFSMLRFEQKDKLAELPIDWQST